MSLGGYRNYSAASILPIRSQEALSLEIQSGAAITHLKISPNGDRAALARVDSRIELFHRGTLAWSFSFESDDDRHKPIDYVRGLAFSHDESRLFVLAHETCSCFSVNDNELLWERSVERINAFQITYPVSCLPLADGVIVAYENGTIHRLDMDGEVKWQITEAFTPRWMRRVGDIIVGLDGHNHCQWDVSNGARIKARKVPNRVFAYDRNNFGTVYRTADHVVWVNDAGESAQENTSVGLPSVIVSSLGVVGWGELNHLQLWWPQEGRRIALKLPSEIMSIAQHPVSQHFWLGLRDGSVMSTSLNIS